MNEAVAKAARLLRERLSEIADERRGLEKALKTLEPGTSRAARRNSSASGIARRRPKRAPRGQRQAQFLKAVKQAPGSRVSEIAKSIGVRPQQLYAIGRRLEKEGVVVKKDGGYSLAAKRS